MSEPDARDGKERRSYGKVSADDPMFPSLLARAVRGEEAAWKELVTAYSGRVYGLLRSQGAAPELAEEITQSVFCTLAAKLSDYVEGGRFESWLFRIAVNRLRDDARRKRRHAKPAGENEVLEALAGAAPDRSVERADAEEISALRTALLRLSETDREVIDLRHIAGMSFKQIADHLGEPMGTLLARHHRALGKLRAILQPEAPVESPRRKGPS